MDRSQHSTGAASSAALPRRLPPPSRPTRAWRRAIIRAASDAGQPVPARWRGRRCQPAVCLRDGAATQAAARDRNQGRGRRRGGRPVRRQRRSRTATRCSLHLPSISGFAEVDQLFGRQAKFTRADFIPIARLTEGPMVLVVNDTAAVQDVEGSRRGRQEATRTGSSSVRPVSTARCICRPRCSSRRPGSRCATCPRPAAGRP